VSESGPRIDALGTCAGGCIGTMGSSDEAAYIARMLGTDDGAADGSCATQQQPAQPAEENAKSQLNSFLMRYCGKPVVKGDIVYECSPAPGGNDFSCILKLPCVAAKEGADDLAVPEFFGEDCETEKMAEQSAAKKALDNYADWIAANPAPPPNPNNKKKNKNKKRPGEPLDDDANRSVRPQYDLKFVDAPAAPDRENAAEKKSLNNQPAWMTRGLGVNKDLFGESKGNLVKPGMYQEDIDRIEARKGNPLGDGPDPFGDVFAERKAGGSPPPTDDAPAAPNPWRRAGPLPPQSMPGPTFVAAPGNHGI